jgi:hypothetical protein
MESHFDKQFKSHVVGEDEKCSVFVVDYYPEQNKIR